MLDFDSIFIFYLFILKNKKQKQNTYEMPCEGEDLTWIYELVYLFKVCEAVFRIILQVLQFPWNILEINW